MLISHGLCEDIENLTIPIGRAPLIPKVPAFGGCG